jgi:hypothetical protein
MVISRQNFEFELFASWLGEAKAKDSIMLVINFLIFGEVLTCELIKYLTRNCIYLYT